MKAGRLLLAAVLSAGCAGVIGGSAYEPLESRSFDYPAPKVFEAAKRALVGLGLAVSAEDPASGTISAAKRPGWDFVSRRVKVTLQNQGDSRTLAGVESEVRSSSPFFNARPEGFNREILYQIGEELKRAP